MNPAPCILIIDDRPFKLEALWACLAGDYDLQCATSGPQGLERVRQQAPDLILLDSRMAGYWLLQALRADPATRDIPVICVTAQGDSASEAQALAAGAVDCIQQPINPPVVRARVRLQLELRQRAMACIEAEQRLSESLLLVDRALAEATALQARFLSIFDQSPIGIALLDAQGGQLFECNERYAAIVGRSVEQMHQLDCLNITHPDDQPLIAAEIARLQAGEIPSFQINARFLRSDHSSVWTRCTFAPVQVDATGHPLLLSMVEDITEQTQAEQKLLQAKEAAEQASRAKTDFVANMSHEVRTPMNAVLGFLDILADSGLQPQQRALVAKVQKSSRALLRILNDILDFSKLDAGAVELELAPFELDEVLRDATELLALTASAKGLELMLDLPPDLPQHYRGDALRLGQVLLNLLGNAVKFTERGSVRLSVRAQGETGDGRSRLRFEVRDSGMGMEPEQVERLFQPFMQADNSTTRRFGGTGLGLTIAKRLVELMGGEIGVDCKPGQGTTFWFSVPLAATTEKPAQRLALPADALYRHADPIRGARLLLVEDNPTNQEIALAMLGKMGLQVSVAHHGREALDQLAGQPFDLVLMDLQMPVMDGFEATAAIRATDWGRDLPIVAMTAAAFDDDRRRVHEAGMNDFVSKPVDSKQLLGALLRWLPHRPQEDLAAAAGLPASTGAAAAPPVAGPAAPQALLPAELDGFEHERTLQRLGQDQDLLLRALRQFLHDFPADDWAGQLDAACRQADWVSAQRQAHTLKGVAGNLGAVRVQQAATALDALLKTAVDQSGCDPDQLAQRREDCLQALRAATAELQDKLPAEAVPALGATEPAQPEAALQDLAEAEQLLRRNRGLPAALLPRLRAHLGQHAARAQFDRLTDQVSAFDFDGALETIKAMRERLSS